MLNTAIQRFLVITKKEQFTFLDYLIHFAVLVNLIVALAIVVYMYGG
jgi:hypothetical protein